MSDRIGGIARRRFVGVAGVTALGSALAGLLPAPHPIDYQRETLAALKEIAPDYLIPMHCAGEAFISIAMQEMSTRTIRSSTGTRLVFGA